MSINQRNWKLKEEKLTQNFFLFEFIYWANKLSNISESDRKLANKLSERFFTYKHYVAYKAAAWHLQSIRNYINRNENEYGIIVTCGHRPIQWEKHRGRKGSSQHTVCAIDFVVVELKTGIRRYDLTLEIFNKLNNENYNGGLAVKYTQDRKGAIFCHIDYGVRARWEY